MPVKKKPRVQRHGFTARFNRFLEADHPRGIAGRFKVKEGARKRDGGRDALPLGADDDFDVIVKGKKYKITSSGERVPVGGDSPTKPVAKPSSKAPTKPAGKIAVKTAVNVSGSKPSVPKVTPDDSLDSRRPSSTAGSNIRDEIKSAGKGEHGTHQLRVERSIEHIKSNQSKTAVSIEKHGMRSPEDMHSVEFEGVRIHYPAGKTLDFTHPAVDTMSNLLSARPLPPNLTKSTTDIYLTSHEHRGDASSAIGFRTAATGAHGQIVVYRGKAAGIREVSHEMGHNFAEAKYESPWPDQYKDFGKLQKSKVEPVPSEYGKTNNAEDFAESVRIYVQDPDGLKSIAPRRHAIVKRLMEEDDYGG